MISKKKLFISGSCVTRDAFMTDDADMTYLARSSLISAMATDCINLKNYPNNIKSSFQNRMVCIDLSKSFTSELTSKEYDCVLLDFIDERFDIWINKDKIATVSHELKISNFNFDNGRFIKSGSDEWWILWNKSWKKFILLIEKYNLTKKILINNVRYSYDPSVNKEDSDRHNRVLDNIYEIASQTFSNDHFIFIKKDTFNIDHKHKWGLAAYHYTSETYNKIKDSALINFPIKNIDPSKLNKESITTINYHLTSRDLDKLKANIFSYNNIDDACENLLRVNGIHSIPLSDNCILDIYVSGIEHLNDKILVNFCGAASFRKKSSGPFFSGLGVSSRLKIPIIAIADPSLALSSDLVLAWYAGNQYEPKLNNKIANILNILAKKENKELIIFGGSGGGFASLSVASYLNVSAEIFVWNPQTSISNYAIQFVLEYIEIAFPSIFYDLGLNEKSSVDELYFALNKSGIDHDLKNQTIPDNIKIIYLQNSTDGHLTIHAEPFLTKKQKQKNILPIIECFSEGHNPPSKELVDMAIKSLNCNKSITDKKLKILNFILLNKKNSTMTTSNETIDSPSLSTDDIDVYAFIKEHKIYAEVKHDIHKKLKFAFYLLENGKVIEKISYSINNKIIFEKTTNIKNEYTVRGYALQKKHRVFIDYTINTCDINHRERSILEDTDRDLNFENIINLRLFSKVNIDNTHIMSIPYSTNTIQINNNFNWDAKEHNLSSSDRMWFYSLNYIGNIIEKNEVNNISLITILLNSYFKYVDIEKNRNIINNIPSADHAAATRLLTLVSTYLFLKANNIDDIYFIKRLIHEIIMNINWISDNKNYRENNHGLMCSQALLLTSQLALSSLKNTSKLALNRISNLASLQFDSNGLCNENSIGYHNFNVHIYKKIISITKLFNLNSTIIEQLNSTILLAEQATMKTILPSGEIPPIGDSPKYKINLENKYGNFIFKESGFAVIKRKNFYLSVICGGRTEIHKQMDCSSIYLNVNNEDIIIDSGSYSYNNNDIHRKCIASSFGHSGLFHKNIEGLFRHEIIKKYGPIETSINLIVLDHIEITCTYKIEKIDFICERTIKIFDLKKIVITDNFNSTDVTQRFIMAPDLKNKTIGNNIKFEGINTTCSIVSNAKHFETFCGYESEDIARGWSSYTFGELLEANDISFMPSGNTTTIKTYIDLS
ncbi:MAG: heparinase II/III family protein [Saccharospirillaceae bacterium]|nr:heparinase II/III-family protein [Pseudomonadales bacterium]NRB79869.1 heparinase II/III family protein [Saccharospirillaceae bacterium]